MKYTKFLVFLLFFSICPLTFAQSTAQKKPVIQVDDELAKALEKSLAELESLRRIKSLQAEQIEALQGKIGALEDLVKIERERADAYKRASEERKTANELDEKRVELFRQSLDEFKAEVERLRRERDSLRKNRNMWTVAGAVFGIAVGVFLKSGN